MDRDSIGDLLAFLAVARERSFTRAAAKLGIAQSSLSHTVRALETSLGVRLLTRTTRSVAPTEAGERLLASLSPCFEEIEAEVAAVTELGEKPGGSIRITAIDYAIDSVILPRLASVLSSYPDLKVEVNSDYRMVDIVKERFDIGVRWGDQVAKDMIAVRLAPDMKQTIVGSAAYFEANGTPRKPQELLKHNCIVMRLASSGGLYHWELMKGRRQTQVRIEGQMILNGAYQVLSAAIQGIGLAFLPEDLTQPHIQSGQLRSVMEDWCPVFPGLHAYYPSRRQSSKALNLVIDAIRMPR